MSRLPVSIVTGFLGSGKTTLLGQLLTQPGFENTLVIINEFGEAGIDHDLIEASGDDTVLLANGCLCCTIRGNLVDTLLDLERQVAEGRLRPFDRVLVETSGLADPAAMLDFLLGEPAITAAYAIAGIVTTCEAVNGAETLARFPEARSQVQIADRLLLTKTDLVGANALAEIEAQLRRLNPAAALHQVQHGVVPASALFGATARQPQGCGDDCAHDHHHAHDHTGRFRAITLTPDDAFTPDALADLAEAVRRAMGPDILRLKALLPLRPGGHAVLQGNAGRLHPVETRQSPLHGPGRLVIITEGADASGLRAALRRFGLRETGPIVASQSAAIS